MQSQANDFSNSQYTMASPNYEFAMKPMPKPETNNSNFEQFRNNFRNDIKHGNDEKYLKENLIPKEQLQYEIPKTENQKNKITDSNTNWNIPVDSQTINSPYGWRIHPIHKTKIFHHGIDIKIKQGSPVKAITGGTVSRVQYLKDGYGYNIMIDHDNNISSLYAHLSQINVEKGQIIKQGDVIAKSGGKKGTVGAGGSTGEHLHFEIRKNGKSVDPNEYFKNYFKK